MSDKKTDKKRIIENRDGELDAMAMRKPEQSAQHDTGIKDALNGHNINTMPGGHVASLKVWLLVALVILIIAAGGLWINKTPSATALPVAPLPTDNTKVAIKDTLSPASIGPVVVSTGTALPAQRLNKGSVLKSAGYIANQAPANAGDKQVAASVISNAPSDDDTVKEAPVASELVAMNYTQNKKAADSLAALIKKANEKKQKAQNKSDEKPILQENKSDPDRIKGTVFRKDGGSPIIGAAIRIKGTNKSTVTDVDGVFNMQATGNTEILDIAYIGYTTKQVSAKGGDNLNVTLIPEAGSLDDVVNARSAAHPETGWNDFKNYLRTNAITDDGSTGNVSVTFSVSSGGSLTDFKVKKSLAPAADQKAIDLIKAGPAWTGNNSGKTEEVTVKVKFSKQKPLSN